MQDRIRAGIPPKELQLIWTLVCQGGVCDRALPAGGELGGRDAGLSLHAEEEKTGTRLRDVVDELAAEGVEAVYKDVAEKGPHTAHAIADVASDEGADVIVVGTRGHTALTGLLLGSVTMRLLHVAPCPVLSIPATKQPAEQRDIEIAAVG